MSRRRTLALVFVVGIAVALEAAAGDDGVEAAILEILKDYQASRVEGDAETWLNLWDEDGVQMPPGQPDRKMDELKRVIPETFGRTDVPYMEISPHEVLVNGDWALSRSVFKATFLAQGMEMNLQGKFLTVFRRQPDGTWRIFREMFQPF